MYTVREVAEALGISRVRTYELVKEGKIPSVRLSPRRIRIPVEVFEAWLLEQSLRSVDALYPDVGRPA